ncbi:MAG: hypothetical protein ACOCZD_02190 [Haloferacaceae archaeon]
MSDPFRLEIDADFGNGETTGVFEAFVNAEDTDEIRTGYLLGEEFDQLLAIFSGLLEDGEPDRKGLHLDFGGGVHVISLRAEVSSGETRDEDGETLQWGDSSDPGLLTATTATGGTARQKAQIFQHYTRVAEIDSRAPATLEFGEYSDDGVLDPLEVVFEQPQFSRRGPDKYEFSCTFLETESLERVLDGSKQTDG